MHVVEKLSLLLQCLNSDDSQTKLSARSSFQLHMNKRKAIFHEVDDSDVALFGNYEVNEEGRIIKRGKVNWPKSIWVGGI